MLNEILLSVSLGCAIFLVLHIIVWRLKPSDNPRMLLLAFLACVGLLGAAVFHLRLGIFDPVSLGAIIWIEFSFIIVYLFVYAGLSRSVSITLLERLRKAGAPLSIDMIADEYKSSSRFEDRIVLMRDSGLVDVDGERVTLTDKGRSLASWTKVFGYIIGDGLQG